MQKTILLVEDEAILAMAERMVLERNGYRVLTAYSGERAILTVDEDASVDLILMDIDLGSGIDGTQAAQSILSDRKLPIVFLSSHTEPEVVEKTEGITSYGYIVKNSGETVLLASIKMAFRLFEAQTAIHRQNVQIERTNEELRGSEERFRSMVEGAPVPIYIQTRQRFAYLNPAAVRLFGAESAAELTGTPVIDRCHPDFHERIRERIQRLNERRESVTDFLEQKYLRLDGSEVWVETVGEPIEYEGEMGALVFSRDITARHEATEILERSEALLKETERIAHLGSWELNLLTGVLTWSDETYRIFGLQPQEFDASYEAFLQTVHPDDRDAVNEAYTASVRAGNPGYEIEHRIVQHHSGLVRRVWEKCVHYRNDEGKVLRSMGMVRDVTDQKIP